MPEIETVKDLQQEIVKVAGDVDDGAGVKGLTKHLRTALYPLLTEIVSFFDDVIQADPKEYISEDNANFVVQYVDMVQQHIHSQLQRDDVQKDMRLKQDLFGLFQVGQAVKKIVLDLAEAEEVYEEIDVPEEKKDNG